MIHLSKWAAKHIIWSRLIISLGLIVLYFLSGFIGFGIYQANQNFMSEVWLILVFLIIIPALIYYPTRKQIKKNAKSKRFYFRRWKSLDITFLIAFCILGLHFGYDLEEKKISENKGVEQVIDVLSFTPILQVIDLENNINKRKNIIRRSIDKFQTWLVNYFSKRFLKNNEKYDTELIIFILFFVLLYVGLIFLLAVFACGISCNGMPALAGIVFIGGQLLLFFLLYLSIYGISNWLDKKYEIELDKKKNRRKGLIFSSIVVGTQYLIYLILILISA